MELIGNNVKMDESDLEIMRSKGFDVDMHTSYYANHIGVTMLDGTSVGFHCWLDNLEFYINGCDRVYIKSEKHLEAAIEMMESIVKFNSLN